MKPSVETINKGYDTQLECNIMRMLFRVDWIEAYY